MGKTLQTSAKRNTMPSTKKPAKRATRKGVATKSAAKPTLRELNRLLTRNHNQVLQKAKENSLRLIGRETL